MPNQYVYVYDGGSHDLSRWLHITGNADTCTIHLTDLCIPGFISQLTSVTLPTDFLCSVLAGGTIQVSVGNGYFLTRRDEDRIRIEFRSREDASTCKATVQADEFEARLRSLSGTGQAVCL